MKKIKAYFTDDTMAFLALSDISEKINSQSEIHIKKEKLWDCGVFESCFRFLFIGCFLGVIVGFTVNLLYSRSESLSFFPVSGLIIGAISGAITGSISDFAAFEKGNHCLSLSFCVKESESEKAVKFLKEKGATVNIEKGLQQNE